MNKFFGIIIAILIGAQTPLTVFADDLKKASAIARHGARFQSERLKIAAENIANEDSTGATPGADAYRRKVIFAENKCHFIIPLKSSLIVLQI